MSSWYTTKVSDFRASILEHVTDLFYSDRKEKESSDARKIGTLITYSLNLASLYIFVFGIGVW